jgi:hypothetical protein
MSDRAHPRLTPSQEAPAACDPLVRTGRRDRTADHAQSRSHPRAPQREAAEMNHPARRDARNNAPD